MPLPGSPANALPPDDAAIVRRLEAIERTIRELGPSVAGSIFPIIASLQAQADATDAVVAGLADVVNAQVAVARNTASTASAISVSPGNTYTTASVTVPAGYTRALVVGVTSATANGANPLLRVATDISGDIGFDLPVYANSDNFESGTVSHSASLTGLSGGGTVYVGARVTAASSVTNVYFVNTITVTFLR